MKLRSLFLAGTGLLCAGTPGMAAAQQTSRAQSQSQPSMSAPAQQQSNTQQTQPPPDITDDLGDDTDSTPIVVTGVKPRGSVVGDIPPEQTLDSRDIQATGATSIDELLTALGPQVGSTRVSPRLSFSQLRRSHMGRDG